MAPRPPLKPSNGEQKLPPPPPPLQQQPPQPQTTDESLLQSASDSDLRTLSDRLSQMRLRSRALTMEEVSKHCSDGDVWIAVQGKVYDLSKWCESHPGGKLAIMNVAGKDATDPFLGFHTPDIWKKLALFQIGVVRDYRMGPLQADLHRIREELYRDGKFVTNWWFYAKLWTFHMSLLALAVGLIFYGNNTLQGTAWWPYLLSASILGLFWQQVAFHGHDLGHNALFQDYRKDWLGSLWVTLLFGVSGQWWKRNHNTHHIVTNSVEHDPDIQHLPFLAISEKIFRFGQFFSTYYERYCTFDESAKYFVSRQHFLYLLVMILARYNLYVQSALLILNTHIPMYKRHIEATVFCLYFVWLSALLLQLPSLFVVLVYLFISHAVAGIIHVQITLSHFACDVYYGRGYEIGDEQSFFRTQLETSVDVDCPEWFDWFHGGLQFQVEHHVFPRVPRHNLRYVMNKYIKPLAAKYNLPYQSLTFTQLLARVLQVLRVAAHAAESTPVYSADGKPVTKSEDEAQAINQARLRKLLMAEG